MDPQKRKKLMDRLRHRRRVEKYRKERLELIRYLGGKCHECGQTEVRVLEFDHLNPREWVAKEHGRWNRLQLYKAEAEQGLIGLRCRSCNASKGKPHKNKPVEVLF